VVELAKKSPRALDKLRPIGPLVMKYPLFDDSLLRALHWAANRYVAPLAVLLERTTPPNLANRLPAEPGHEATKVTNGHPLGGLATAIAEGKRRPPAVFLTSSSDVGWLEALASPILRSRLSLMAIVATGAEAAALGDFAARIFGEAVVVVSADHSAAEVTLAWAACQLPGRLLIGTPRISTWQVAGLGAIAVVEEGRRAMKDRQTPTISVRDLVRTRASVAGLGLVFVGPTPTTETVAAGPSVIQSGRRTWPPVEIVDRRREERQSGFVTLRALGAIKAVAQRGGRVFVFAHRRSYAPAFRCRQCRTLRRCSVCGSRPEPGTNCIRCGASLGPCQVCGSEKFVPMGAGVGRIAEELRRRLDGDIFARVTVGSEADLADLTSQSLTVAVDADGLILGTHYRASEEALRILARLVSKVEGPSGRGLVQTSLPDHPVITALRSGNPMPFLAAEVESRRQLGLPPAGQLLIIETRGAVAPSDEELRRIASGVSVLGPMARVTASGEPAQRWLLQGRDLGSVRLSLRSLIQQWREAGTVVRIDSDPIDL
jgi:primosomal protein N' (replication factor Y)